MTGRRAIGATRELACLFRDGTAAGLSDRQLLQRFAARRDEASFAALVGRHGPMVLGVCRRIVRDCHEAEDAFQATFLVLTRKAGSIRVDDSLGRWLYTVARRIALRADASAARRGRVVPADDRLVAPDDPGRSERREIRSAIDDEVGRLPESFRDVVVLCDLEGLTHREAARRLRCPIGTVKGRLTRARGLLRGRLARRGLGLSAGSVAAGLQSETVSAGLLMETVSAAIGFATARATPAGMVPAVVALAREALGVMLMARIKLAAVGLLAFGAVGLGMGRLPGALPALALDGAAAPARPATRSDEIVRPATAPAPNDLEQEAIRHRKLVTEAREAVRKREAEVVASKKTLNEIELRLDEIDRKLQPGGNRGRPAGVPATTLPAIEGRKRVLPDYIVEPPDLISVEILGALPGRPITGERLVRPDGKVSLQFYGEVDVAGLTTSQIKEKIVLHLRKYLTAEALGLVKKEGDRSPPVEPKDSDRVAVEVVAYNSKVYYVQGDVATPSRLPVTGSETVLDAITYAGGLLPTASAAGGLLSTTSAAGGLLPTTSAGTIRVVRPAPPGSTREQVLSVDFEAIVKRGDTSTNYQILPGDRIIVDRAASPAGGEAGARRRIEERLDAMTRELEAFRRELREGR